MPKYIDEEGNEVELLSAEEQKALQEKIEELTKKPEVKEKTPEELEAEKKAAEDLKNKEVAKEDPTKEEEKLEAFIKEYQADKAKSKDQAFKNMIDPLVEDEEIKKKVRQSYDVFQEQFGMDEKEAFAKALEFSAGKKVNPLNGITGYNNGSGVPGSKKEDEHAGLKAMTIAAMPKSLQDLLAKQ